MRQRPLYALEKNSACGLLGRSAILYVMLCENDRIQLRNARYGWQNAIYGADILYWVREYAKIRWLIACRREDKRAKRRASWWRTVHHRVETAFLRLTRQSFVNEHARAQDFSYVPFAAPSPNIGIYEDNRRDVATSGKNLSTQIAHLVRYPHGWSEGLAEDADYGWDWVGFCEKIDAFLAKREQLALARTRLPPSTPLLAKNIGARLKHYREESGLTQSDLADLLDNSESYVWMLENGRCSPSLRVLRELSDLYNVPAHVFMLPMRA